MDVLPKLISVWTLCCTSRESKNTSGLLCLLCWMMMFTVSPWQQYFVLLAKLCSPAMIEGKYHLPPYTPSTKFWNKCSLLHYLLSQYHQANESSIWNHIGREITCRHRKWSVSIHHKSTSTLNRASSIWKHDRNYVNLKLYSKSFARVKCTWFRLYHSIPGRLRGQQPKQRCPDFLPPDTSSSSSRSIPKPAKSHSLSSLSRVYLGAWNRCQSHLSWLLSMRKSGISHPAEKPYFGHLCPWLWLSTKHLHSHL